MKKNLKKTLSKKWYKSKSFTIGSSIFSVGVITTAIVVPVYLSLNENESIIEISKPQKPQLSEIEIKLNKLNNDLDFSQKAEVINKYLNHVDNNGKTPVDFFIEKLENQPKNIANFILSTYPDVASNLSISQLESLKNGKGLGIIRDELEKIKFFPSKVFTNQVIIWSFSLDNDMALIVNSGFSSMTNIDFSYSNNSFFVKLYNNFGSANSIDTTIQTMDNKIIYKSSVGNYWINFLNYGFDDFDKWFTLNIFN